MPMVLTSCLCIIGGTGLSLAYGTRYGIGALIYGAALLIIALTTRF